MFFGEGPIDTNMLNMKILDMARFCEFRTASTLNFFLLEFKNLDHTVLLLLSGSLIKLLEMSISANIFAYDMHL